MNKIIDRIKGFPVYFWLALAVNIHLIFVITFFVVHRLMDHFHNPGELFPVWLAAIFYVPVWIICALLPMLFVGASTARTKKSKIYACIAITYAIILESVMYLG